MLLRGLMSAPQKDGVWGFKAGGPFWGNMKKKEEVS